VTARFGILERLVGGRTAEEGETIMANHPDAALRAAARKAAGGRLRAAALACGGMLLLAACGGSPDHQAAGATTTSRLRTPAETCALQVGYWANELLKPNHDKGYDYQEMGLTTADFQLVLDITKAAKRLGPNATHEQQLAFVNREAQRRCANKAPTCTTTGGAGWPC
jgi:hypothetical protein